MAKWFAVAAAAARSRLALAVFVVALAPWVDGTSAPGYYSLEDGNNGCSADSDTAGQQGALFIDCSDGGRTLAECAAECSQLQDCGGFGYGSGQEACPDGRAKCNLNYNKYCDPNHTWHWHAMETPGMSSSEASPPPSPPPSAAEVSGVFKTKDELRAAVVDWVSDATAAEATHGHISGWDVSQVEDMTEIFKDASTFNEDISGWDTSKVKEMNEMFNRATAFNQRLDWDTSTVTNMYQTFVHATSFNQPLAWDTSKVDFWRMQKMFLEAHKFNQRLDWDTSKVGSLLGTFNTAKAFDQPLAWDTSEVTEMANVLSKRSSSTGSSPGIRAR